MTEQATNRQMADQALYAAENLQQRPELQQARAAMAQGYALLALADVIEAHTAAVAQPVASVLPEPTMVPSVGPMPDDEDPTVTRVRHARSGEIVWSAPWTGRPYLDYVPAHYLRAVDGGTHYIETAVV